MRPLPLVMLLAGITAAGLSLNHAKPAARPHVALTLELGRTSIEARIGVGGLALSVDSGERRSLSLGSLIG